MGKARNCSSENPHSNVAKGATLEWGTLLFLFNFSYGFVGFDIGGQECSPHIKKKFPRLCRGCKGGASRIRLVYLGGGCSPLFSGCDLAVIVVGSECGPRLLKSSYSVG
jgi:hypothetical protein